MHSEKSGKGCGFRKVSVDQKLRMPPRFLVDRHFSDFKEKQNADFVATMGVSTGVAP